MFVQSSARAGRSRGGGPDLEEKGEAAERGALLRALGFLAPALFFATGGQGAVIGFFAAPAEFSVTFAVCHCVVPCR